MTDNRELERIKCTLKSLSNNLGDCGEDISYLPASKDKQIQATLKALKSSLQLTSQYTNTLVQLARRW